MSSQTLPGSAAGRVKIPTFLPDGHGVRGRGVRSERLIVVKLADSSNSFEIRLKMSRRAIQYVFVGMASSP